MPRFIKILTLSLAGVVGVVALAFAALVFIIDPNIFRDDIERLAEAQGVNLALEGDLSWQLFPDIQLVTGAASLNLHDSEQSTFMHLDAARLSVALMPLLRKEVIVQGIGLDGVVLNLSVDQEGVGNWTKIVDAEKKAAPKDAPAEPEQDGEDVKPLQLAIASLRLNGAEIHYRDAATGQDVVLRNVNLRGDNVQLSGQPIPVALDAGFAMEGNGQQLSGELGLAAQIGLNEALNHFSFNDVKLDVTVKQRSEQASLDATIAVIAAAEVDTAETLQWSLGKLELKGGQLSYADKAGMRAEVSSLTLSGGVSPGGEAAPISLRGDLLYKAPDQQELKGRVALDTTLQLGASFDTVAAKGTRLVASLNGQDVTLSGDVAAQLAPLAYEGAVAVTPFDLRKMAQALSLTLPEMAGPGTLSIVGLEATVKGNDRKLSVPSLRGKLDNSTFTGKAELDFSGKTSHTLELAIDRLNADHYLPPVEQTSAQSAAPAAPVEPAADELPIPRELLNTLNADAKLTIGELVIKKMPMKNLLLQASAKQGLTSIAPLKAQLYDGNFVLDAQLDSRGEAAKMSAKALAKQIPIGRILEDVADNRQLAGLSDVDLQLKTSGATVSAVKKNLNGLIELNAQQLRLNNMNIERAFCQLVMRLQQETFNPADWPAFSELRDTKTRITITDGLARIQQLNSGVSKLALTGEGKVDLTQESFDVVLGATLKQADQQGVGCAIRNEKLLDREIPIRCKADFNGVSATSCLPDFRVIEDIAKDKAKAKVQEKAREAIDKKIGGENSEAAKELFNKFFKK